MYPERGQGQLKNSLVIGQKVTGKSDLIVTKISESNRRIKYRNSFGLIKNSLTGLIIRECISKDLEIIEVLMEVSDLENKIGQEQGKSFLYIF